MQVLKENGAPVKMWTDGVPVEDEAKAQLLRTASLPFVYKHVAVMPDVHVGLGATIGSVVPTIRAIIPAAVGVDIGCGMIAQRLDLGANDLPDHLGDVRSSIEAAIPVGRTSNGGPRDEGSWRGDVPSDVERAWGDLSDGWDAALYDGPDKLRHRYPLDHLGTLGTGNHFIEVCLDEADRVWVMLHSGSRGPGNAIGRTYIEAAKREMERWHIHLPDKDLSYLPEGSQWYSGYIRAVTWAQRFAQVSRNLMIAQTIRAVANALGRELAPQQEAVNCHHNYVAMENHFGRNVWVTRKGAVRAREGDWGIIPGSMGARSFIVRGKGNPDSFHSCSHGAGRVMSRRQARERFSVEDHKKATDGVECRKDDGVLDETPGAYKDIAAVMEAQSDLVDVVHTLRQVVCVKG